MNRALAVGPCFIAGLDAVKVGKPVLDRCRSFKDYVDRVVAWQVPDEAFNILALVVEGQRVLETLNLALVDETRVGFLATVGVV